MKTFIQYIGEEGESVVAQGTTTQSVAGLTGEPPVFPKKAGVLKKKIFKRKAPGVMNDSGSTN